MAAERWNRRWVAMLVALPAVALIAWFETHHRIPLARAGSLGSLFIVMAALAVILRGVLRNAALVVATTVLCLAGLEGGAVLTKAKDPMGGLSITPRWLVSRPEVGFGFDRAMTIRARKTDPVTGATIFEAFYTIGPTLDRVVRSAAEGPATVFFGDSFTFGEGLNDADTLPQKFADLMPGRVLNLGVTGYSPQQFLREVETGTKDDVIGGRPRAFVFLTSPFHAMRTACKENWTNQAPRYALDHDRVVYKGACREGLALFFQDYLQNSALYRLVVAPIGYRLTGEDVALYVRILAEAVRLSREKYGVETLVPFMRWTPAYLAGTGWDNDAIMAALRARGVRLIDATLSDDPATGLIIPGDWHPTGAANAIRARMIAAVLAEPEAPVTASSDAASEP